MSKNKGELVIYLSNFIELVNFYIRCDFKGKKEMNYNLLNYNLFLPASLFSMIEFARNFEVDFIFVY